MKSNSVRLKAFTLAEILITLGVIGVVAAVTMPTLIQNYKKKAYATKVHKAYAEMLQAIRLSEAQNGPLEEWKCEGNEIQTSLDFVETYIKPYYKDLKLCTKGGGTTYDCGLTVSSGGVNYITNNGVGLSIVCNSILKNYFYLIIDVNAGQKPNALGTDAFYFNTVNEKNLLLPFGFDGHPTREQILQGFNSYYPATDSYDYLSCKKEKTEENELNRHGCTLLLYLDNWEFKDDYPWE